MSSTLNAGQAVFVSFVMRRWGPYKEEAHMIGKLLLLSAGINLVVSQAALAEQKPRAKPVRAATANVANSSMVEAQKRSQQDGRDKKQNFEPPTKSAIDQMKRLDKAAAGPSALDRMTGVSTSSVSAPKSQLRNKMDSRSEMGESQSLRVQHYMDRYSKSQETLSNIQRKQSETSSAINRNIR